MVCFYISPCQSAFALLQPSERVWRCWMNMKSASIWTNNYCNIVHQYGSNLWCAIIAHKLSQWPMHNHWCRGTAMRIPQASSPWHASAAMFAFLSIDEAFDWHARSVVHQASILTTDEALISWHTSFMCIKSRYIWWKDAYTSHKMIAVLTRWHNHVNRYIDYLAHPTCLVIIAKSELMHSACAHSHISMHMTMSAYMVARHIRCYALASWSLTKYPGLTQ